MARAGTTHAEDWFENVPEPARGGLAASLGAVMVVEHPLRVVFEDSHDRSPADAHTELVGVEHPLRGVFEDSKARPCRAGQRFACLWPWRPLCCRLGLLAVALAASLLPCVGSASSEAGGLHWRQQEAREPLVPQGDSDSDHPYARKKAREIMKQAVDAEGERVARVKQKLDQGSGFVPHGIGGQVVEADGSVAQVSRSRKDSSVFYDDEALREAVEDRPDVFQHPPIEDSDEFVLWLSIAEAQAKVERRQRELNRRLWVAAKRGDVAQARLALEMGASPQATDPNGTPVLLLAAGGGQVIHVSGNDPGGGYGCRDGCRRQTRGRGRDCGGDRGGRGWGRSAARALGVGGRC